MARKDLLSRLADAGEEAIAKLAETPGGDRLMGTVNSLRDRIDELQRRVRGIDELERRVTELERRVGVEPAGAAATLGSGAAGETAPDDLVPPAAAEATPFGGIGDIEDSTTVSPTPPPTPPPPGPVEGGASEGFGGSPDLPGDRPPPPIETTEPKPSPPPSEPRRDSPAY